MPRLTGVPHRRAVEAFEKVGFWVVRQGKHISMTDSGGYMQKRIHSSLGYLTPVEFER